MCHTVDSEYKQCSLIYGTSISALHCYAYVLFAHSKTEALTEPIAGQSEHSYDRHCITLLERMAYKLRYSYYEQRNHDARSRVVCTSEVACWLTHAPSIRESGDGSLQLTVGLQWRTEHSVSSGWSWLVRRL